MNAILDSFILVAVSEMGDKTQLLALVLAARFKKPWAIMAGILVATLFNHALAAFFGGWLSAHISPEATRWIIGLAFLGFAAWMLIPDKADEATEANRFGPFLTTVFLFFLAEMGDKTQLATVALGAKFAMPIVVTMSTTAAMLLTDGLAIFFGERLMKRVPMHWIRYVACALFGIFGIVVLLGH